MDLTALRVIALLFLHTFNLSPSHSALHFFPAFRFPEPALELVLNPFAHFLIHSFIGEAFPKGGVDPGEGSRNVKHNKKPRAGTPWRLYLRFTQEPFQFSVTVCVPESSLVKVTAGSCWKIFSSPPPPQTSCWGQVLVCWSSPFFTPASALQTRGRSLQDPDLFPWLVTCFRWISRDWTAAFLMWELCYYFSMGLFPCTYVSNQSNPVICDTDLEPIIVFSYPKSMDQCSQSTLDLRKWWSWQDTRQWERLWLIMLWNLETEKSLPYFTILTKDMVRTRLGIFFI